MHLVHLRLHEVDWNLLKCEYDQEPSRRTYGPVTTRTGSHIATTGTTVTKVTTPP